MVHERIQGGFRAHIREGYHAQVNRPHETDDDCDESYAKPLKHGPSCQFLSLGAFCVSSSATRGSRVVRLNTGAEAAAVLGFRDLKSIAKHAKRRDLNRALYVGDLLPQEAHVSFDGVLARFSVGSPYAREEILL